MEINERNLIRLRDFLSDWPRRSGKVVRKRKSYLIDTLRSIDKANGYSALYFGRGERCKVDNQAAKHPTLLPLMGVTDPVTHSFECVSSSPRTLVHPRIYFYM